MTLDARDAIDTCQLKETDFPRLLINVAHANLNVHTSQVLLKKEKKKEEKIERQVTRRKLLTEADQEEKRDRVIANLLASTRQTARFIEKFARLELSF